MNKRVVEDNILKAYKLINDAGLVKDNKLSKTFRGYISTFGAAITMGSLRAAIAFYSEKSEVAESRDKLMKIVCALITQEEYSEVNEKSLMDYVEKMNNDKKAKKIICDAAISVKLAMNMYTLV